MNISIMNTRLILAQKLFSHIGQYGLNRSLF
jgi:hypothetical protein